MRQLQVGIIGQGRSGYAIHAHTLGLLPDLFTVVAVADEIPSRTADAAHELGASEYTDYRELLARDDLDLVVNASYSDQHVPISLEAMAAGRNVLCEKPLAPSVAEVDRLVSTQKKRGVKFAVFQQSRFAPYFRTVRSVIDSGALGRIVQINIAFNGFTRRWDWQTLQSRNGGSLMNTGPHPLDQALQLYGEGMPEVFCIMDRCNTAGDAEDHVKLILHGRDRPTIDLEISSCAPYTGHTYQVYGTRGGLTGTMTHIDWKYYLDHEAPPLDLQPRPLPDRAYCREELPMHEESWDATEEEKHLFDYMGVAFYRNLHAHLTKSTPLAVSIEQVRRQIAVIEEAHRQGGIR